MEPFPDPTDPRDTSDTSDTDLVDQLLLVARGVRERTDTFTPLITWQPVTGGPAVMTTADESDTLTGSFDDSFNRLRKLTGPPDWFAVTLDAYARDQEGDQPKPEPGALHEAFTNGDPSVVEQMVVILMDPTAGDLLMARQVYRWTPVDGWEWDEPQMVDSPDDAVCTAVRMYR